MARREPVDIVLGGKPFKLRPMTFAQVEAIETATKQVGGVVAQGRSIIIAGLSRDHAAAVEEITTGEMEADAEEIARATKTILSHAGFLPDTSGEAGAAAQSASNGVSSEAG